MNCGFARSEGRRPHSPGAKVAACVIAMIAASGAPAQAQPKASDFVSAQARNPLICDPLPGYVMLLDDDRRVALVANIPGTNEPPSAVSELACAMSARGPLVVGLEWRTDLQPWLDAFMASDGGDEALAALVNILDPRPLQDAPSIADIALLERLRRLAHAGRKVRVVAWLIPELEEMPPPVEPIPTESDMSFDLVDPDEDLSIPPASDAAAAEIDIWRNNLREPETLEEAREAFMADMLQAVSGPHGRILVLASRERVQQTLIRRPGLPAYPSFAMMYPPRTALSLEVRHDSGVLRACDTVTCRFERVSGNAGGDLRMVARFPALTDGFNGVVLVGPLTQSPTATPALPAIAYQAILDDGLEEAPAQPAPPDEPDPDSGDLAGRNEPTLLADAAGP